MLRFNYEKFSMDARRAMRRQFHSFRSLSKACNIPHSTIHRQLNNPSKMSLSDFVTICHELDLTIYDFIDDDWQQVEMFR